MNVIRSEKSTPTWPNSHIEGPGKGPFNRNVLGEYQIHIFAQEKTYTRVSGGLFRPPPPLILGRIPSSKPSRTSSKKFLFCPPLPSGGRDDNYLIIQMYSTYNHRCTLSMVTTVLSWLSLTFSGDNYGN